MAATDLSLFSDPSFDPKAWVNEACTSCPTDEPLEKYLSELEMKLQLLAEDVTVALEEQSAASLRRLPRALAEVSRTEGDVKHLASSVETILHKLESAEATSAASVASLAAVDKVKRRMESARDTLQEAAGLADLLERSEEVMSSGNIRRMADTLAAMRRGLQAVGNVPEFADGRARVTALTDRLESLVQPELSSALVARDADRARELEGVLASAGRISALDKAYVAARLQPLLTAWDSFSAPAGADPSAQPALADWLPAFYDEVLALVDLDIRWCAEALPAHSPRLLLKLLAELAAKTQKSFLSRLTAAVALTTRATVGASAGPAASLPALIALHNTTVAYGKSLCRLLEAASPEERRSVLEAAFAGFESFKRGYGDLERRQLGSDISRIERTLKEEGSLEAVARRMNASVAAAAEAAEGAVQRCVALTGGSEADAMLRAVDDGLVAYLTSLHALLRKQRQQLGLTAPRAGQDGPSIQFGSTAAAERIERERAAAEAAGQEDALADRARTADAASDEENVQGALELLGVAGTLTARLTLLENFLKSALKDVRERLSPVLLAGDADGPPADGSPAPAPSPAAAAAAAAAAAEGTKFLAASDAALVRLAGAPEKARRLRLLLDQALDTRFAPLPHSAPRAVTFAEAVDEFVYDVLSSKIVLFLKGMASLSVWNENERPGAFNLPQFSAYPGEKVTAMGEYLLTLPALLEAVPASAAGPRRVGGPAASAAATDAASAADGEERDEASVFAEQWMAKVGQGAAQLYLEEATAVRSLTPWGARQMHADAEYLSNVLSALSVQAPPGLGTLLALVTVPAEEFFTTVQVAGRAGDGRLELDPAVVDSVSRMRGISSGGKGGAGGGGGAGLLLKQAAPQ